MSTEVLVPVLGAEERSPVIAEWYKPDGAEVRLGEPVYRLETDFIAIDVEAEEDGVLRHWIEAGQSRRTGQAVAVIFRPGELEDEAAAESDLAESVPLEALAVDPELASEQEALAEKARITDVQQSAAGYSNYQQWLAGTKLEQHVSLEDYSVSNRGLRSGLVGTPEQVRSQVSAFEAVGVDFLLLQCSPQLEEMERFAKGVIAPSFSA